MNKWLNEGMDSYIDDRPSLCVFVQVWVPVHNKHLCELRLLIRCRSLAFHHFFWVWGFLDRFEGCWDAGGTNPPISCRDFAILLRDVASMPLQCFLGAISGLNIVSSCFIMFHHFMTAPSAFGSLDPKLPKTCTLRTCMCICKYVMQPRLNTERVAQSSSFMNLWALWLTKARRVKISGSQNITFSSGQWTTALTSFPAVALACRISAKGSPMP